MESLRDSWATFLSGTHVYNNNVDSCIVWADAIMSCTCGLKGRASKLRRFMQARHETRRKKKRKTDKNDIYAAQIKLDLDNEGKGGGGRFSWRHAVASIRKAGSFVAGARM